MLSQYAFSTPAVGLPGRISRASRIAPALVACLALSPLAGWAQPATPVPAQQEAAASDPAEPVAIVAGKPVTAEEITSFGILLATTERRSEDDPAADLEDFILTRLHRDVYTTVPVSEKELGVIPTKYKYPSQRGLLQRELRQHIEQSVQVTPSEMETWYEANIEQYVQPESITAHHLFMETSQDEPTSTPVRVRQRMEQVKREADGGTSFAILARRYSEAASGAEGGMIGTVRRGRPFGPQGRPINPRLEDALFTLQPGEISDIVQTSHGLHLLYAGDRTTTVTPTLEDFVSSGIVQRALTNDKLTSARASLIAEAVRRHDGRIADIETTASQELTTATPAIHFGGNILTVSDIEKMYGLAFTRAFSQARTSPEELRELYKQVLDLEAEVQAAIDAGLDKRPDIARNLALLGERAEAGRHIQAIFAQASAVTEEQQRAEYERIKESLRRPEIEGWVITLMADASTTEPAAMAKASERLEEKARQVRARLDAGEDFETVARAVSQDDLASSGGIVPRHVLNMGGVSHAVQAFDVVASRAEEEGEVVGPTVVGDRRVIAKVGKRHPGEPIPFEQVQQRLVRQVQIENQKQLREEILRELEATGKVRYLPGAARFGKQPTGTPADEQTSPTVTQQQ